MSVGDTCVECLGPVWVSIVVVPVMQRERLLPVCVRCLPAVRRRRGPGKVQIAPEQVATLRACGAMDVALDTMLANGENIPEGLWPDQPFDLR